MRKWGQNFLRNPSAVRRIVEALEPNPEDLLLEIGPGEGVLTRELARLPNEIVAIEIDPSLFARLRAEFGDRVTLIQGDATEVDLPDRVFRVVGNLPYYVATPIIRRVLASPSWRRAVFMVQKEVADRFTAHPREEAYGYLTLLTQLYARTRKLMTLEPGSFHPRPKVRSAVVVFEPLPRSTRAEPETIEAVLSAGFRMRRKKLLNNLEGFQSLSRVAAAAVLDAAAVPAGARAEELSLQDFDRLAVAIGQAGAAPAARRGSRR
jgi:16S rRNA (adenine1518-N6/adenine1519-N6)-dimethyltransferase